MLLFKKLAGLVVLSIIVVACNATPEQPVSEMPDVSKLCKEPRPQMCTMIYQPVCGVDQTGQFKTYSSDCNACSHVEVAGFNEGACEDNASTEKQGPQ